MKSYLPKSVVHTGFTLIELMVTIAIFAIILSVAAPAFTNLIASNNVDNAARRLANMLAYARSEAVSRSDTVTLCASANQATCGTSANWNDGWIVLDPTNNRLKIEDASQFSVNANITDDGNANSTISALCFDVLGEVSNSCAVTDFGTEDFVTIAFTDNGGGGESSSIVVYKRGAVRIP